MPCLEGACRLVGRQMCRTCPAGGEVPLGRHPLDPRPESDLTPDDIGQHAHRASEPPRPVLITGPSSRLVFSCLGRRDTLSLLCFESCRILLPEGQSLDQMTSCAPRVCGGDRSSKEASEPVLPSHTAVLRRCTRWRPLGGHLLSYFCPLKVGEPPWSLCLPALEESWPGERLRDIFRGYGQLVERPHGGILIK